MENQHWAPGHIPAHPGVYFFKNSRGVALYIGKAANLKKRLTSYFRKNVGEKVRRLRQEATKLEWQETESEIEALILEARLIKERRPKYNVLLRDDKNYFFVGITAELFPKIFITHQPQKIQNSKSKNQNDSSLGRPLTQSAGQAKLKIDYLGPYTSGIALKTTLRLLRKIFPYCTCMKPHQRPCLNAQIGRCLGFCCDKNQNQKPKSKIQNEEKIYNENIKNIIAILRGKKQQLATALKKQMRDASRKQDYERAARLRDQISGLEEIFAHRNTLELPRAKTNWRALKQKIRLLVGATKPIARIEGYDISNISGSDATGSMVVFQNGTPDKNEYRKFKIKTVQGANDPAMIKEILNRRLGHREWQYPDLIIIDGGKPQFNAALRELRIQNLEFGITITALAKKEEELYVKKGAAPIPLKNLDSDILHLFQAIRDESHRFAKKYHHKLREIKKKHK